MSLDINTVFNKEKLQKVHQILQDTSRKIIVVDGVIGAGKTTTIKEIEKRFIKINADNIDNKNYKKIIIKAIYEPVELWKTTGALEYFYEDIPKNAYAFQTFTYITRIASVIDEIYDNPDADIYILERSIWTDRYIFMELLKNSITKLEMTMYFQWCDMWAYILPMRVDKWVLLNTSLNESLKRIDIRDRNGEKSGVSVEYQTNLYKKHIEFYNKLINDGKPVVIIESNIMDENIIDNDEKIDNIIGKIIDIDMNKFKNGKNNKYGIISWLLDLI
jgi:deoxyadenosine/deoxycytidine kinase